MKDMVTKMINYLSVSDSSCKNILCFEKYSNGCQCSDYVFIIIEVRETWIKSGSLDIKKTYCFPLIYF